MSKSFVWDIHVINWAQIVLWTITKISKTAATLRLYKEISGLVCIVLRLGIEGLLSPCSNLATGGVTVLCPRERLFIPCKTLFQRRKIVPTVWQDWKMVDFICCFVNQHKWKIVDWNIKSQNKKWQSFSVHKRVYEYSWKQSSFQIYCYSSCSVVDCGAF